MPDRPRNAIGPRVRQLRLDLGLTLEQLAGRIGISASHLSRLERGQTSPSFTVAAGLARELGVTAETLFETHQNQVDIDGKLVAALTALGMSVLTAAHIRNEISASARCELFAILERFI